MPDRPHLVEQIVTFLGNELPEDILVSQGRMDSGMTDRCATVFCRDGATGRVQVLVRGDRFPDMALNDASAIYELLDDFTGLFTPDGNYILNIETITGPAHIGLDQNDRHQYSMTFQVYYCE